MGNLIQNEQLKIYIRPRTWVLVGLVVLSLLINAIFAAKQVDVMPDWKEKLTQQIQQEQQQLLDPSGKLSPQKRSQLQQRLTFDQYRLDHNLPPTHTTSWLFAKGFAGQLGLAAIVCIVIAGDIVSSEFAWGTIKLLLIRPVTRTKIYLSKYIATLLFSLFLIVLMGGGSLLVGGLLFGLDGLAEPYIPNVPLEDMVPGTLSVGQDLLITYGAALLYLWVVSTIAYMFSAASRSSVLAITLTMVVTAVGEIVAKSLPSFSGMKFWLFTNTSLLQYFEGIPPFPGMTLGFSLAVIAVYLLLFHAIAWAIFTKSDVAA
ncbi:ABC transporter permease [Tumebacillus permanentifrigoris]|uniref:ABC-2 type transport system permease protein n=1 Tax=Tumebacillus permanentifrigoris TaxID=378543 RepID=A0A316D5R1_9BACL|nr:ABC transporter permease [Tumebacillus permanentifrigoris]PWK05941.1 ABC-2 type transport system permease protein [Tumebacillus permanentifrigoris]